MSAIIVFAKLLCSANISCNHLVFQGSSLSCRNFIGYYFKYGSDFAHNYRFRNILVGNLIREISDNRLFVYGFDQNMIECTIFQL